MASDVLALWQEFPIELQGSFINAAATILTGTLAAFLVLYQIGRQARHALNQNRHNETLKLKLQMYKEIVALCEAAGLHELDLSSFVQKFSMEVSNSKIMRNLGIPLTVPSARIPTLLKLKEGVDYGQIELIRFIERWIIIDPRLKVFQSAFNAAKFDIDQNFIKYFERSLRVFPQEIETAPGQLQLFPWQIPDDVTWGEFVRLQGILVDSLSELSCYVFDFQVELQNLFVGELFDNQVPVREPIDPKHIVVTLAKHKALASYFDAESPWGKHNRDIREQVGNKQAKQ